MARILVIDDSPTETYRFREILQRNGHEVMEAANG
ncbi:MAG: response regulator, partial [Pedobacter sp.]